MLKEPVQVSAEWEYRTANTKEYTHGIHPYPAMMIPQVARRLIRTYGQEGGVLFDPYCGTGTTLLEGMLAKLTAIGTDLNPLARLIARTKTTPIDIDQFDDAIESFAGLSRVDVDRIYHLPDIPNVDYWFSARVQRDLARILSYIESLYSVRIADVFKVAFSLTVRKVSWTKNPEFKLVRISPEQMQVHDPDVFAVMSRILGESRSAFSSLRSVLSDAPIIPSVYDFNSVTAIPEEVIAPRSVDIVVTSPPYGDSRTTVAYGQFSRLSAQWLGHRDANRIDQVLMGGAPYTEKVRFGIPELDSAIGEISTADSKRASEVTSFFIDYWASISNVAEVVKLGGYACYVVGNRTVKGIEVPTAEATAAFFEAHGFRHIDTFRRNIPNKRMPSMNSPSNVPGEIGRTIKAESIVICRRVR